MITGEVETHPLAPFIVPHARLLMLGSFPPSRKRWKMDFYYPNFQNDMWRIFGCVFFNDRDYFVDIAAKTFQEQAIRHFLYQQGIAISDVAYRIKRLQGNASDKFLQIEETVDLPDLLSHMPQCRMVLTTGEKATDVLASFLPKPFTKPAIATCSTTVLAGRMLQVWRLPSSSRAYPLPLAQKAAVYQQFFAQNGWSTASCCL